MRNLKPDKSEPNFLENDILSFVNESEGLNAKVFSLVRTETARKPFCSWT